MIARLLLRGIGCGTILVLVVALSSCRSAHAVAAPPTSAHPLLQKPLPDFRRATLDGSAIDSKGFGGRVVVLELFAEHCVPCGLSLPEAEKAHRERPYAAFVGLSEDDDASGAVRMVTRHSLTFPVVHDADRTLAGRLRLTELPSTLVADVKGTVRWVGTRSFSAEELTSVIDRVTDGSP